MMDGKRGERREWVVMGVSVWTVDGGGWMEGGRGESRGDGDGVENDSCGWENGKKEGQPRWWAIRWACHGCHGRKRKKKKKRNPQILMAI